MKRNTTPQVHNRSGSFMLAAALAVATTLSAIPAWAAASGDATDDSILGRIVQAVQQVAASVPGADKADAAALRPRPATGQVVGYYEVYRGTQDLPKVAWQSLTRLNLAFVGVDNGGLAVWLVPDGKNQPELGGASVRTVRAIVEARNRNNPNVKLLLSVGGASMSNNFSKFTRTAADRLTLAKTAVGVANALGLDGVDWDWEYPGRLVAKNCADATPGACESDDDYANMVALMTTTRSLLAADQLQTAAVFYDLGSRYGVPYDVPGMNAQLDAFNIMAYDMDAPSWTPKTAFPAALSTATASLDAFAKAGAAPEKLILGVPFYAYVWRNVPWAGVDVAPSKAQGQNAGRQYSVASLFAQYSQADGCKLYETAEGDYYYCDSGAQQGDWCPIDSARIITAKGNFVRDNGYGGLMSWATSQDTDGQLMTRTMAKALR